MVAAAYASVLSVLRVIDNIQLPSCLRLFPDTTQIDALKEKLCFLQDFFEGYSSAVSEEIEHLARKIPEVTNDAESIIDKYVVYQLKRESQDLQSDEVGWNMESFHNGMHQVIQELKTINEALTTLRMIQHDQEQPNKVSVPSLTFSIEKKHVVGFDDQLEQVLEKLISNQRDLLIVPIVGMGGIGKTTLARSLFDHPYNLHRFQVRIWLTISQDYSVKKVLQGLLADGVLKKVRESGESQRELITQLHKRLFRQRYLIVLDDVWSTEAWDDLKWGFPNDENGSRVMVTTRLSDIASSMDSRNNSYSMKFLDSEKSWDLFSAKAFEKGGWSRELGKIGREISKRCKGLPLMLVLIGGLLANSDMTVEYWQVVSKDIHSFATSVHDEYCLRILSLSYYHLPIHLKPCFLYTRHFEEDSEILVSKLIKTWVMQGFVKSMRGKSLEEAAREYLEDLVGRNMLLIRKRGSTGNIKICGIHDLLRDMCINESNKEQLLEIPRIRSVPDDYYGGCFFCEVQTKDITLLLSEVWGKFIYNKILVCSSCESKYPELARSTFAVEVKIRPQNVPRVTECRGFIEYSVNTLDVLHTIRLLWNIQTLHICVTREQSILPKEIWEMPQLRHVMVDRFMLPDPISTTSDAMVLENLQSLKRIAQFKCTEEIVTRIPNLRKLDLFYNGDEEEDWSCFYLRNLAHLQKLESLSIHYWNVIFTDFKKVISFPCSLKKLTLIGSRIAWDGLTIIGSLPNLEMFALYIQSVTGKEWNPIEGEFLRLKYLKLSVFNLVHWRVNKTHFPALETLFILDTTKLEAIPREIGELPSLNLIYLKNCKERIIDSAKVVVEEQLSYGNERLLLRVEDFMGKTYEIGGTNV